MSNNGSARSITRGAILGINDASLDTDIAMSVISDARLVISRTTPATDSARLCTDHAMLRTRAARSATGYSMTGRNSAGLCIGYARSAIGYAVTSTDSTKSSANSARLVTGRSFCKHRLLYQIHLAHCVAATVINVTMIVVAVSNIAAYVSNSCNFRSS